MSNIGIIQFPGSNCERETRLAVSRAGMNPVDVMWHCDPKQLDKLKGFIIIGGFSYEDRCRAGAIAARSTLVKALKKQADLGKPILGICNGAQILVESGLVPGIVDQHEQLLPQIALTDNQRIHDGNIEDSGYINDWCHIQATNSKIFGQQHTRLHIPFAHAQGRFVIEQENYQQLRTLGVQTWQYCDQNGDVSHQFPSNPNGSLDNLAAISNIHGNVLAMMPHPERTPNGDLLFRAMREYIKQNPQPIKTPKLNQSFIHENIQPYSLNKGSLLIKLNITDNEATSVEQAINQQLNLDITIKKWVLWDIDADADIQQKIVSSQELFNPNKESICQKLPAGHACFMVENHSDVHAKHTLQSLEKQCQITGIKQLKRGVIWGISGADKRGLEKILSGHLLSNPVSQKLYQVET